MTSQRTHLRGVRPNMPLARGIPLGTSFIRVVDGVDLNHPQEAAEG
jgi:hypothetical protein